MKPSLNGFAQRVVGWQRSHGRNDLPWSVGLEGMGQLAAYRVWLSEVMLQQTQVATVRGYFAAFTARFPRLPDLASADINDVLALWAGLGYYSRARNLHRCAQQVMAQHAGVFPSDLTALQALPGIGPSTAAAIASLAFGHSAAILDGNVKRVLARHGAVAGWAGTPAVGKALWALAQARLSPATAPDHHRRYTQGLMDLGATVCHAKQPDCARCPVASDCAALLGGLINTIPEPRPKKTLPVQTRSALILHTEHGVWLTRRPATGLWGGLLSLPEAADNAALTHLAAQWLEKPNTGKGVCVQPWHIHTLKHTFTHYQLHWTVWALAVDSAFTLPAPWVFAPWAAVKSVGVPKAVLKVLGDTA